MILPIIMICVCALMDSVVLVYMKMSKKMTQKESNPADITANEFVNVRDIGGKFLFTRDNMVLAYLRIMPISINLLSKSEKQQMVRQLTANPSSAEYPFKLLAVSRPVNISLLLTELSDTFTACGNAKKKELLKQEMLEMNTFALFSDGAEQDLLQKLKYLEGYFSDVGVRTEILEQQDIVRLCNLINNPSYVHLEDSEVTPSIPVIMGCST